MAGHGLDQEQPVASPIAEHHVGQLFVPPDRQAECPAFGVKMTTIRSQLQQVFGETGTSRQAELVARLLSRGYVDTRRTPIEPAQEFAWRLPSYFESPVSRVIMPSS